MNLPEFVKSLAFWTAVSWAVAGVLGLLVYFGVLSASWALPAAAILSWILALLNLFGVKPELMAKATAREFAAYKASLAEKK